MAPVYTPVKRLSFEEYLAYDTGTDSHYELLESGELIELPYENRTNVLLALALFRYLEQFLAWDLFSLNATAIEVAPMTIKLPNGRTRRIRQRSRIPDLMVLSELGATQILNRHNGLALDHDDPLLIVEFVSQSNSDEDYTDKRSQYEARGVREYWIADRHQGQVVVLSLEDSRYQEQCYQADQVIQSPLFPDFALTAS